MKKLMVTAVCIFFLFSLIVFAQNETNVTAPAGNTTLPSLGNTTNIGNLTNATLPASGNATHAGNASNTGNATQAIHPAAPPSTPPAAPRARNVSQPAAPTCGNGQIDSGETCVTCLRDVCKSGQGCNSETGQCETITNFTTYIIVGVGIFVLLGLFFFAKRIMKKKEEPVQRPPAAVQAQKPMVQQPPFGQQQTPQPNAPQQAPSSQPSPVAQAQIQMPPSMTLPPSMQDIADEKDKGRAQGFQEMSEVVNEHPGETMPQKFIRQMREKGWNDERIRMKLKESGWSETQIALEFLKTPKFVKKQ